MGALASRQLYFSRHLIKRHSGTLTHKGSLQGSREQWKASHGNTAVTHIPAGKGLGCFSFPTLCSILEKSQGAWDQKEKNGPKKKKKQNKKLTKEEGIDSRSPGFRNLTFMDRINTRLTVEASEGQEVRLRLGGGLASGGSGERKLGELRRIPLDLRNYPPPPLKPLSPVGFFSTDFTWSFWI